MLELTLQDNKIPEESVELPSTIKKCRDIKELISEIYPGLQDNKSPSTKYLTERTILSPRNEEVSRINDEILSIYTGRAQTYIAADKMNENIEKRAVGNSGCPSEVLNNQNCSGLPPFRLNLKVGCPVMMLRNIDPKNGLCNGTRLRVETFAPHVIEATILTGDKQGTRVFIPRISLSPCFGVHVHMTRRQFPIRLAFAMTINKSQGQSVKYVGIDLRNSVFGHGQLYVALSRCTTVRQIKILLSEEETNHRTGNVVYPEVLLL
ncbi:ATP-dependent DNA helicase PIF1-like [Papaver somniferum]|uniref:ATP-dependent DNA helicase PIF1-like n=1 Tax=Papaver somniferum TaxID=3469 RepID=UPI000E6FCB78|nr:ATP-dependent DNA helicase PIF1-like [Papaver somniferum]